MAQIANWETCPDRANKSPAVARQLNDLRAELLTLQLAMSAHVEMNSKGHLRDIEIVVPARREKSTKTRSTESAFGQNKFGSSRAISGT
jgi:hypothetical protein